MPVFHRNTHTTYYEEVGTGDPLVLICGLGADLQVWRFMIPELSKRHRVICFDNRGAGRSSAPDEPYSVQLMATDLVALLDHLYIQAPTILGWSMGGVVAQSLALSDPHRVRRLILLNTLTAPDGYCRAALTNWMNVRRSNMSYEHTCATTPEWCSVLI
jgi:3-oxoadipate enol-lactonase